MGWIGRFSSRRTPARPVGDLIAPRRAADLESAVANVASKAPALLQHADFTFQI